MFFSINQITLNEYIVRKLTKAHHKLVEIKLISHTSSFFF